MPLSLRENSNTFRVMNVLKKEWPSKWFVSWRYLRWTDENYINVWESTCHSQPCVLFYPLTHSSLFLLNQTSKTIYNKASLSLLPHFPFGPWLPALCTPTTPLNLLLPRSTTSPSWFPSHLWPFPLVSFSASSPLVFPLGSW